MLQRKSSSHPNLAKSLFTESPKSQKPEVSDFQKEGAPGPLSRIQKSNTARELCADQKTVSEVKRIMLAPSFPEHGPAGVQHVVAQSIRFSIVLPINVAHCHPCALPSQRTNETQSISVQWQQVRRGAPPLAPNLTCYKHRVGFKHSCGRLLAHSIAQCFHDSRILCLIVCGVWQLHAKSSSYGTAFPTHSSARSSVIRGA